MQVKQTAWVQQTIMFTNRLGHVGPIGCRGCRWSVFVLCKVVPPPSFAASFAMHQREIESTHTKKVVCKMHPVKISAEKKASGTVNIISSSQKVVSKEPKTQDWVLSVVVVE